MADGEPGFVGPDFYRGICGLETFLGVNDQNWAFGCIWLGQKYVPKMEPWYMEAWKHESVVPWWIDLEPYPFGFLLLKPPKQG